MVCYRVIVAPYVRSVGHVFAYLYTLDNDSECPMDYETSVLPKVFPLQSLNILENKIVVISLVFIQIELELFLVIVKTF